MLVADDVLEDAALSAGADDRFEHDAIAGRVSELVCAGKPPLNIALYGPYGSGKSGFFTLLREDLQELEPSARLVRYDAWKYGGRSLKRNFIYSVARSLGVEDEEFARGLHEDSEEQRLDLWHWISTNWRSLALGVIVALCVATAWLFAVAYASMLTRHNLTFRHAVGNSITGAGTVLGIVIAALLVGPKVMESANVKISQSAPEDDDQFAQRFEALVTHVTDKGKRRLVVFIDELDRCAAEDVVATLVDLMTFLDQKGCIFIVTADREVLEDALKKVPQVKPVRDEEPYYSTPGAFLDKVFQHQLALPPLRPQALTRFARTLVLDHDGLWSELRAVDENNRLFDEVVYTLIPAHVRSPRRVKVLLNNYATDVRIAQARGIDWLVRATEIAKLTVLRTEFPTVAAHLPNQPRLLSALLESPSKPSPELDRLLRQFAVPDEAAQTDQANEGEDSPAGGLLTDDGDSAAVHRAAHRLNQQLRAYLAKTRAANVADPRPDLLYLQGAGAAEGLHDPELGEVIDFASDTDPSTVVDAFRDETSSTVAIAARLLAARSDGEFGPGKANLAEAACRLFEALDPDDATAAAPLMAPSVLVALRADGSRPAMLPGALALGARAASGDLINAALDLLDSHDGEADVDLLDRLVPVLGEIDDESAARVEDRLGSAYREHPDPLHLALRTLPERSALRLWKAQAKTVRTALDALLQEEEEAEPTAPAPTRPATAPTASAAATDDGTDEESETVLERFTALLDAVTTRDQPSEVLTSLVLLVGQEIDDMEVYIYTRQRAEAILPTFTAPSLLNDHALVGVTHGVDADWDWWTSQIHNPDTWHAPLSLRAVRKVLLKVPSADLDVVAATPAIIKRLAPFLAESAGSRLGTDISDVLGKIEWDDDTDSLTRRRIVHEVAQILAPPVTADAIAESLSMDVMRGIGLTQTEELRRNLIAVTNGLYPPAAELLDAALAEYDAPADETALVLRLLLIARTRYGGTALDRDQVLAELSDPSAPAILETWLSLHPSTDDAIAVLSGRAHPKPAALSAYAAGLTPEDRTQLWTALEEADAPLSTLTAISAAGIDAAAVRRLRARLAQASRQPDRDAAVNRMLTIPLESPSLRIEASEAALELLNTGIAGNAALAAKIVIAAGGAARGYTDRLRQAFDKLEADSNRALSKTVKQQLASLRIMTKPKKSTIGRILGR